MIRRRQPQAQAGFTLVELMISLVLFSFAIAGVLAVAVSMTQGLREQRAAVGAETSARVPLDFISDAIRQASPAVPNGNILDAATCTTSAITITDGTVSGNGWDTLDLIFASGGVVTSSETTYTSGLTTLTLTDTSQLQVGDSLVLTDTTSGVLVKITGIAGSSVTITTPVGCVASSYNAPFLAIRAMHATFTIASVDGISTLMMDPDAGGPQPAQPLAEGVEDMQIAQGYDNGAGAVEVLPGSVNGDQWWCNVVGETGASGQPLGQLRALRISLVTLTTSGLVGTLNPYNRPQVENHSASVTFDQFRRRVLNATVELRNYTGSP